MRKASLTSQSTHFCVVIRKNTIIDCSLLDNWLKFNTHEYAYIKHENDIHPVTSEVEGVHYHLVFNTISRHQVAWVINQMRDLFGFNDANGIEVDIYKSFEGSVQYLTHQNEPLKTPHKKEEIVHNLGDDLLSQVLCSEVNNLTFDTLYGIILRSSSLTEVVKAVGLSQYNHLRNTIKDLWGDAHH